MTNKEAIKILTELKNDYEKNIVCRSEYAVIVAYEMAIKALERPHAYWKDHRWCSNCGCGIPTDVYGTSITEEEAHFCVECGARMEANND